MTTNTPKTLAPYLYESTQTTLVRTLHHAMSHPAEPGSPEIEDDEVLTLRLDLILSAAMRAA